VAPSCGTLPLDEQRRNQAEEELAAELRAFLDRGDAEEADAAHAREALGLLGGERSPIQLPS
jgi:hypothetical protein